MNKGFSLLELLIATTICAVIAAGIAVVVPPSRAAFERTPAELDLQQRGRTAVDVILQAIRTAGGDAVAAEEFGPLAGVVPAVIPFDLDPSGRWFRRLSVIVPPRDAAQGVLWQHQAGAGGDLVLSTARCPIAPIICGFNSGTTAVIADGSGRFDVFSIAAVQAATARITPARRLRGAYAAGSIVVEVDAFTFQLDAQPDASLSLVRVTAGGAVQPVVDRIASLRFEPYGFDPAGELAPIPAEEFADGPWWSGGPDGDYDDDVFRVKRVDVVITLQAAHPLAVLRTFRFAAFLRNVP